VNLKDFSSLWFEPTVDRSTEIRLSSLLTDLLRHFKLALEEDGNENEQTKMYQKLDFDVIMEYICL